MKYLLVVLLSIAAFNAYAGGSYQTKKCASKPSAIVTVCDLKAYSTSRPGTTAYAMFQGVVVGVRAAATSEFCAYSTTDAQLVGAVQNELKTIVNCKELASELITRVLQRSGLACL